MSTEKQSGIDFGLSQLLEFGKRQRQSRVKKRKKTRRMCSILQSSKEVASERWERDAAVEPAR